MRHVDSTVSRLVMLLLLLGIAPNVRAEPPQTQRFGDLQYEGNPTNADVAKLLARNLSQVKFDGTEFDDVVDFLRDITGTQIYVDWTTLRHANIDRKAKVTVGKLKDVPFGQALTLILDNVAGKGKADWSLDDGVITISTADALTKGVVTRVYDVRFLRDHRVPATQPTAKGDALYDLIRESIVPDSWGKKGPGRIDEVDGQLIITAPGANQKLIASLLDNLKKLLQSKT